MQPPRKKRGLGKTTVVVATLLAGMLVVWYSMHSMLSSHTSPAASEVPPAAAAAASSGSVATSTSSAHASLRATTPTSGTSGASGTSRSRSITDGRLNALDLGPPTPVGLASLTPRDVSRLAAVLGPTAHNFTRSHFITIPSWVTAGASGADAHPLPPCLFAAKTKFNVYLFEDGWRDAAPAEPAASGAGGGSAQCPSPVGGQLPMPSTSPDNAASPNSAAPAAVPEVSVVLAFRNMATETIRALLSIVHNARDVASIEILLLDIASRYSL